MGARRPIMRLCNVHLHRPFVSETDGGAILVGGQDKVTPTEALDCGFFSTGDRVGVPATDEETGFRPETGCGEPEGRRRAQ